MGVILDALKYIMGRWYFSVSRASTASYAEGGRDIETEKAYRGAGQAGGWNGRIARSPALRESACSLLPLSNAPPQPKRQQAARSRDLRNEQATAHEAAKATRPLNRPLLGHFRLPSLLSQPWDGGMT